MGQNSVEVRVSKIQGSGLFATKDFKTGEKVYSFLKGRVISEAEIVTLSPEEKIHLDKIANDQYEVIESPACYVNHSCDPNVAERDKTAYALRDIQRGEELTIDYDRIAYLEEPFQCSCGAKNCRGTVKGKLIKQ